MSMTEDDDVRVVAGKESLRSRAANFIAVADVEGQPANLDVEPRNEPGLTRIVRIAENGSDGGDRRKLVNHRSPADVAGVQDELDTFERGKDLGTHQ